MKMENFYNLLNRLEIDYEKREIVKNNGVVKNSVILDFGKGHVNPVIYEEMINELDEIRMTRHLLEMKERLTNKEMDLDDLMKNSGWFKTRLRVAVRNREKNKEDMETVRTACDKPFDDLEEYYYLKLTSEDLKKIGAYYENDNTDAATIKVNVKMLKEYGYTKDFIRTNARHNTKNEIVIKPMSAVLTELMDIPFDEEVEEFKLVDESLWVISTKDKTLGASGLLFIDMLKDFATEHEIKTFAILPSSIHECLLAKIKSIEDKETLEDMVTEINITTVQEKEVLSNNAYIIENE